MKGGMFPEAKKLIQFQFRGRIVRTEVLLVLFLSARPRAFSKLKSTCTPRQRAYRTGPKQICTGILLRIP